MVILLSADILYPTELGKMIYCQDNDETLLKRYEYLPNRNLRNVHNGWLFLAAILEDLAITDSGKQTPSAYHPAQIPTISVDDESYGNSPYSRYPPQRHPLE